MGSLWKAHSGKRLTKEQCKDTGMAVVLIFLLMTVIFKRDAFLFCAIAALVVNMVAPQVYRPFAVIWFGFSQVLGTIASRVILSVVFFVVVTPVAIFRRLLHKDSLRLREFKKSRNSVMDKRNHTFGPMDIEKPF